MRAGRHRDRSPEYSSLYRRQFLREQREAGYFLNAEWRQFALFFDKTAVEDALAGLKEEYGEVLLPEYKLRSIIKNLASQLRNDPDIGFDKVDVNFLSGDERTGPYFKDIERIYLGATGGYKACIWIGYEADRSGKLIVYCVCGKVLSDIEVLQKMRTYP